MHSGKLSLFDAHYSVAICALPLSAYVVFSSLLHICGVKTFLFKKILVANHKRFVAFFGLLLLLLWSVTSGVTSLLSTAYKNSDFCRHTTFGQWLEFIAVSTMSGVFDVMGRRDLIDDLIYRQGLGLVSLFCLYTWCIFIVRCREEIIKRFLELFDEVPNRAWARVPASKVLRYLLIVIHIPRACW